VKSIMCQNSLPMGGTVIAVDEAVSFKWRPEQTSERHHHVIRSVWRVGFIHMAGVAEKNGRCSVMVRIYRPVWCCGPYIQAGVVDAVFRRTTDVGAAAYSHH